MAVETLRICAVWPARRFSMDRRTARCLTFCSSSASRSSECLTKSSNHRLRALPSRRRAKGNPPAQSRSTYSSLVVVDVGWAATAASGS